MFKLDHVIIAVDDLDQAIADYRALGFTTNFGGRHTNKVTHNALICFQDGSYLELIAPTGEYAAPGSPKYSPLIEGRGLTGYALLSLDLAADSAALRAQGAQISAVRAGERLRQDGVELRWRSADIDGGTSPFLIEDITARNLRVVDDVKTVTHANGVTGIAKLEGAELDGLHGNYPLTALILSAPKPQVFDAALTHNVKLSAE